MKNFPHVFSLLINENIASLNIFIEVLSRNKNCIIFTNSKMKGGVVEILYCNYDKLNLIPHKNYSYQITTSNYFP